MLTDQTQSQLAILVLASLIGGGVATYIARSMGRFFNFRTLVLINYVLVTSVSGIAHLANDGPGRLGYYDIRGLDSANSAIASTCIGLVALCVALLHRLPRASAARSHLNASFRINKAERRMIVALLVILVPLTVVSTVIIQDYAAQLDTERIVTLDGGMARYSYAAKWFTWTVSFAAILLAGTRLARSQAFSLAISTFSILAIVGSLAWTGGRSIIVVMVLPLILILMPRVRNLVWIALPVGLIALIQYIIALTALRGGSDNTLSLSSWLDWQWGRFSMMGWAQEEVQTHGYMAGETFASAGSSLLGGLAQIAGFSVQFPDWASSTQVAGQSIRRDDVTWIVPGMNAELYLNFGLLGVALGFYGLGRIVNWVDNKYASTPSILIRLTFAFIGCLLVFRSVPSDSGSIPSYLIYMGAPLLFIGWYSHFVRKRQRLGGGSNFRRSLAVRSSPDLPANKYVSIG